MPTSLEQIRLAVQSSDEEAISSFQRQKVNNNALLAALCIAAPNNNINSAHCSNQI